MAHPAHWVQVGLLAIVLSTSIMQARSQELLVSDSPKQDGAQFSSTVDDRASSTTISPSTADKGQEASQQPPPDKDQQTEEGGQTAPDLGQPKTTLQIYGYAQMDSGYNFGQIDPLWFDVMRTSKLPAFKNEFAPNGTVFFSVRQTRFGAQASTPTNYGELKVIFEFDLFGSGIEAGQTTFHLRHAFGELGQFGAGQTFSSFMDPDVFPYTLDYWGPAGTVDYRNVQFRWVPFRKGDTHVYVSVERPGATADEGIYSARIELQNIQPKFDVPDFSFQAHVAKSWGYLQVATLFKKISWVDLNRSATHNLSGTAFGWGVDTSSTVKLGASNLVKLQAVGGEGIENYMNDGPIDIGVKNNLSNPITPIKGVPIPVLGVVSFLEHKWSEKVTSSIGYSLVSMWNANAESPSDFHQGHYALWNLVYHPVKSVLMGGEAQFGRRVNFSDGFNVNDYKLQISFKYSFSKTLAD